MADIDQVRLDSIAQLDAGSGSPQSDYIRDTPLSLVMNFANSSKADTHFQHFYLDSLDLVEI